MEIIREVDKVSLASVSMSDIPLKLEDYFQDSTDEEATIELRLQVNFKNAGQKIDDPLFWRAQIEYIVRLHAKNEKEDIGKLRIVYICDFQTKNKLPPNFSKSKKMQNQIIKIVNPYFRETASYLTRTSNIPDFKFPYDIGISDKRSDTEDGLQ